eukprot:s5801_g2.t1
MEPGRLARGPWWLMAASGSCFLGDMAAGSAEEKSLTEGAPRIKFACHPSAGDAEQKLGSLFSEFRSLCEALSHAAVMLEEIGAAPILPDGFVAGNCSALLQGAAEEMLLVTRSGKDAGVRPSESDFVAVQSFDWNEWSCCFCPAKMGAKPTSDTPLHWACIMKAAETFSWPERPLVALHGHALAEKETLFSTPEDVDALMELFRVFPYPENKVFIRKGHGFLILSSSVAAAVEELGRLEPHFEQRLCKRRNTEENCNGCFTAFHCYCGRPAVCLGFVLLFRHPPCGASQAISLKLHSATATWILRPCRWWRTA